MSEELVQSVQEMLKEETWTSATISNYTQQKFKEYAGIIARARDENCTDDILSVCEAHLENSKNSIIALYISGMISLQKGTLDNTALETLVSIFLKNLKEPLVKYLCDEILADYPNNKFALRTKADLLKSENSDEVWDIYTKLVKIDPSEADLARLLAEYYEKGANGQAPDTDKAKEYYKKAILRYINTDNYNSAKEVWGKLVQLSPEDYDFFQLVRRKIAKKFGDTKTTVLMHDLYDWYKKNKKWETAIQILKQNLEIDPKDEWARKEITDCYRGLYANHSHLEDYIRSSNLTQSYRNVFEAINDFEKHIAFDKDSFVYHRNWGVGVITGLQDDTLTINFGGKESREISLKMAVSTLMPLAKDHIWVLKATNKQEALAKKVNENVAWALKKIIRSFDNHCDLKRIKAELVPSILSAKEWASWNQKAKHELETNQKFGVDPNDINMYIVRDKKISPEEKLSNEFKAQKQFFARIDILMKFFKSDSTDNSSELFTEMYSYFTGYLKNITKVTETEIASYLVVHKIGAEDPQFAYPVKETFAELYGRLDNPRETYTALKDTKNTSLKEDFLSFIKVLPDWQNEYLNLFPTVLKQNMLDDLIRDGRKADVQKLMRTSFESYKDFREAVLYFFKEGKNFDWYNEAGISEEKQLITLINIIELTSREIDNHVNSTENKKIKTKAGNLLFADDALKTYMFSKDEDTVKKLYTLIDDNPGIDPTDKSKVRNWILEKYPDFKFRVEEKTVQPMGMLVTAEKFAEKKARIEEIQNTELPKNAQDISEAREKGDLKENQEYKSAREKQHFLNLELASLQKDMNRATIFDPTTSTTAVVSFATKVTLHNNSTNADEVYTILGPWESDPENNILSYMSPFGNALLDKKVGDSVSFVVEEGKKHSYTLKKIEKASI